MAVGQAQSQSIGGWLKIETIEEPEEEHALQPVARRNNLHTKLDTALADHWNAGEAACEREAYGSIQSFAQVPPGWASELALHRLSLLK